MSRPSLPALGLLLALWIVCQGTHFREMARIWFEGGDMAHGPLVPFVAAYMVWLRREDLAKATPRPSRWGLVLVALSGLQSILGLAADWKVFGFVTFWVSLVGCIWYLYGAPVLRLLIYPLATLLLMIPPPSFLYDRATLYLQLLSSSLAESGLERMGYSVLREGNILEMIGERMSVAEACSGIRALIALIFFCTVYNFFFVPQRMLRAVLWLAALPIAVAGNALRVIITGVIGEYNPALAHGTFHEILGYVSVTAAGLCCILLHQTGERLYRRKRMSAAHA